MAARVLMKDAALVDDAAVRRIMNAQLRETAGRLENLANTTVVSEGYRRAVDAGVSAVQSGVEDYGAAIRRSLREAGQMGLRIREDGTRAVEYASGYTRRLDTAVRQNILDGVRHLNQSIMEEVGREFGADGMEIDAHMLCAEDHLPYQGRQFSNQDFEEIQASLPRPFGEWNCRHSWHPIMMGISQPAYTPEQLQEMRDFSTEEIEIDGRTKTRYEWSQEMRRTETLIRQQKDTAILAEAVGDRDLQRQCQGRIVALNDQYKELAGKAGLQPEFQRTYVQGFKDAAAGNSLTVASRNATMASDSSSHWHTITRESIESVPEFYEFGSAKLNDAVRTACVDVLTDMLDKPLGTEEAISLRLSDLSAEKEAGKLGGGAVKPKDLQERYIVVHNHPSNDTLSLSDLDFLRAHPNCSTIVAIGNNGRNVYCLMRTDKYDSYGLTMYREMRLRGMITFESEDEFLRGAETYGIRYTARTD